MNYASPSQHKLAAWESRSPGSRDDDKQPQLDPDMQQQHCPAEWPHLRSPALCHRGSFTTWSGQMPYTSL